MNAASNQTGIKVKDKIVPALYAVWAFLAGEIEIEGLFWVLFELDFQSEPSTIRYDIILIQRTYK